MRPLPKFPNLRLTRAGKVLLVAAVILLTALPLVPYIKGSFRSAELVESGLQCDDELPVNVTLVVVTTDIGGGASLARPAMMVRGLPDVIFLCHSRSPQ